MKKVPQDKRDAFMKQDLTVSRQLTVELPAAGRMIYIKADGQRIDLPCYNWQALLPNPKFRRKVK